ncbi:MAG: hypothetical protein LBK82_12575 [Planctomycetaceae bacterium]|jgi:hypothetical protein|nr:hypothetical protein [Planctomycetaceae bacterium]
MKTSRFTRFIGRFAVVVLILGIFSVNQVLPQLSEIKQYRKPSESDIEWLLGTPNSQSSQNVSYNIPPCEPAYSAPFTISPKQTKIPSPPTVSQTSGEILQTTAQEWTSPVEFSDNFFSKVQKKETISSPPKNGNSLTNSRSQNKTESVAKSIVKSELKLTPKSQNIQTCSPVTEYPVADNTILTNSNLTEKQSINNEFSCHRCDNNFNYCCSNCTDWGVPEMIGDAAWIPGRSVCVTSQEQSAFFSAPTLLLSRLNLAEHFNAEIKNRIWFDYRRINNATSINATDFRKSRTVDQFTFGLETSLNRCSSVEVRIPLFNQFASKQFEIPNRSAGSATELGNLSLIFKHLLARSNELTFSGGIGVVFPTAENWRLSNAMLKNETYYLVPYFSLQWHPNEDFFGHFLVQTDVPISGNKLRFSDEMLTINESTIVRLGWQLGRWFYRNELGSHSCRLGGFLELDWTITTNQADNGQISDDWGNVFIRSTINKPQPLHIVMGIPVLFGQLTITNAVILPITDNHRSFSVCYDFSLSRRF